MFRITVTIDPTGFPALPSVCASIPATSNGSSTPPCHRARRRADLLRPRQRRVGVAVVKREFEPMRGRIPSARATSFVVERDGGTPLVETREALVGTSASRAKTPTCEGAHRARRRETRTAPSPKPARPPPPAPARSPPRWGPSRPPTRDSSDALLGVHQNHARREIKSRASGGGGGERDRRASESRTARRKGRTLSTTRRVTRGDAPYSRTRTSRPRAAQNAFGPPAR